MKIRIKHILRCYQSGMSIRSISSSLLISRNTVKRYIRIYEDMGIELERLLKMDEQHLHELFGTDIDNETIRSTEYKYLEERMSEYIKRLRSRRTTRRSLYEEYLKNRPQGYSYCSFCLYPRREREVKVPVGRIEHITGDQMYVDFASDKLYLSDEKTGDKVPVEVFAAILPCSQITYYEAVPSQKKEYLIQARENRFGSRRIHKACAPCKKISDSSRTFSRWYIKSCGTFRAGQNGSCMPDNDGIQHVRIQQT